VYSPPPGFVFHTNPCARVPNPTRAGFVQSHYWNVGLLRYYEPKQLPNLALAAPMVSLCACAVLSYTARDLRRVCTLGMARGPPPKQQAASSGGEKAESGVRRSARRRPRSADARPEDPPAGEISPLPV
jgi:hypothetical protein